MAEFTAVIVAILSGGVAVECIRWFKDYKQRKHGIGNTLNLVSQIQSILNCLTEDTASDRAMLIVASNGGEVPKLGDPWYITVFLDAANGVLKSVKDSFEKYKIDDEYISLLSDLHKSSALTLYTDNLNGFLRNVYEPSGITKTDIMLLDVGETWLCYVACNFTQDRENNQEQQAKMDILLNQLKNINIKEVFRVVEINDKILEE